MYPVMLQLEGRTCLVVGGGGVALRKVEGLLQERARVRVVAPEPIEPVIELARQGRIELERRVYRKGEAAGYTLVFAATSDHETNQQVYEDAQQAGVWVNTADDPERCAFHLPARIQRGDLQITISSGGTAPFAVRRLRQAFERIFGAEWTEWMAAAGRFRRRIRTGKREGAEELALFDRFFDSTVDEERLIVRLPGSKETNAWLQEDEPEVPDGSLAEENPAEEIGEQPRGFVSLVGAGPGDAGLLTVKGYRRLLQAEAVVFDHLAETVLPPSLSSEVELHPVGKRAGYHPVCQDEINALLVRLAGEGKRVVRLKGGDPYVFGRGGEEVEVLSALGIPFEVVPGVTAGIAVPAYAGIPVTHRNEAVRVTFVTAHECAKDDGPQVRWDLLAADRNMTLVGYMGVTNLPQVVGRLIDAGMDPQTPAALIERGATSRQRVVRADLANLVESARFAGIRPPAVFVIGPGVRHADRLDWFGSLPLFGERILLAANGDGFAAALERAGAEVVEVPLPVTPAARVAVNALPLTGCVFRSADEVEALEEERDGKSWGPGVRAWCLGSEPAERARRRGWRCVEQLPDGIDAEGVVVRIRRADGRNVVRADSSQASSARPV
jgi:uroporphyrin-III C-methyltransferase / precorrin-2 dehydrogenase / sirohydrochlorin ferrochelatase